MTGKKNPSYTILKGNMVLKNVRQNVFSFVIFVLSNIAPVGQLYYTHKTHRIAVLEMCCSGIKPVTLRLLQDILNITL